MDVYMDCLDYIESASAETGNQMNSRSALFSSEAIVVGNS